VIARVRMRATRAYTDLYNGTYAGCKIGFKYRSPSASLPATDWRSVLGTGNDPSSPGSLIVVCGIGPTGRMELSRNLIGSGGYMSFPAAKLIGNTVGQWKDVTIRLDMSGTRTIRVRVWHTAGHDMSGTPLYSFGPDDAPGDHIPLWPWYRIDFCDWEIDYATYEQRGLNQ
jgi:hypothetical protein